MSTSTDVRHIRSILPPSAHLFYQVDIKLPIFLPNCWKSIDNNRARL